MSAFEETGLFSELEEQVVHLPRTRPLYYEDSYLRGFEAKILKSIEVGQHSFAVLDRTAFFPEGGGQPGDRGVIEVGGTGFEVLDTKPVGEVVVHVLNRPLRSEELAAKGAIDWPSRYSNMKHHTAAHIVFSAARSVLKARDLRYMGFQISDDRVRLDLNREESITRDQICETEKVANLIALRQLSVRTSFTTRDEAVKRFGSNLGLTEVTPTGEVRLVEVGDQDISLCCGTHVKCTIEVVPIKILGRLRLQKGIERIEVSASEHGYSGFTEASEALSRLTDLLDTEEGNVVPRVQQLLQESERMKDELRDLRMSIAESEALQYLSHAEQMGKFKVVARTVEGVDSNVLKRMALKITYSDQNSAAILGSSDTVGHVVAAAGANLVKEGLNLDRIVKGVAAETGCRGGGTNNIAQTGGFAPGELHELVQKIRDAIMRDISGKL